MYADGTPASPETPAGAFGMGITYPMMFNHSPTRVSSDRSVSSTSSTLTNTATLVPFGCRWPTVSEADAVEYEVTLQSGQQAAQGLGPPEAAPVETLYEPPPMDVPSQESDLFAGGAARQ